MATGAGLMAAFTMPIAGVLKMALGFNDLVTRTQIGFTGMLGSAEAATEKIEELKKFSRETPFDFVGLVKSSQLLMAMGVEAEDLQPILQGVGDQMAKLSKSTVDLERVLYNIGQMTSMGKATTRELKDMALIGVPALKYLAQHVGVSTAEMQEMISKGLVPAEWAVKALVYQMEKAAPDAMRNLTGSMQMGGSNIKEALEQSLGALFKPLYDDLVKVMMIAVPWLNKFQTVVEKSMGEETKRKINAFVLAIGAMGPILLGLGMGLKLLTMINPVIGLLALAVGGLTYELLTNKDAVKQVADHFKGHFPQIKDDIMSVMASARELGKAMAPAVLAAVPALTTLLHIFAKVL